MATNTTIPSIASVITQSGNNIIHKKTKPEVSANSNRGWAQIRTARTQFSVTPDKAKYAQFGGTLNNTTTQPNFYSPFLTPSSFQIPNTRKEIYLWANWWRNNEPKVAAGINFYTNFPFNGWKLECKSGVVKDYFEKLIQKLNFQKWLPLISQSYHLYGDAFVLASIDCHKCNGTNEDSRGDVCDHQGATWKALSLLNPDSVMITPGFMDQEPVYSYLPSDREVKVVQSGQPRELYDLIDDTIKNKIISREPIRLHSECIHHFKHGADPWADYGTSLIRPLFVTLAYKDKLRQAQWLIAERHILPVRIVTVGDENRPASQEDLDSVQEQLSAVANDPNLTLVTPHAFDYKLVGANGQVLQITDELEGLNQEILDGLMLNKALLNGEGPAYGNAQVGIQSMHERLETWRREVAQWIEEALFKKVAEWNGFTTEGDGGQEEFVYPQIVFNELELKDNTGVLQTLVTAQGNGVISAQTLVEAFGLNWDQEVERLRFEQGMNFVNTADIMNTDSNIGFGNFGSSNGVDGSGFGGGVNQPLSPGGDMSGMMDAGPGAAGMPAGDMGGAGGAGGGAAPAESAPMTANTLHQLYKSASSISNEISYNRKVAFELRDDEYLNPIDKDIRGLSAVTGRGYLKDIPEDLPLVDPWVHLSSGVPLNYLASKHTKLGHVKDKQTVLTYTNLEKKLYKLIMSMNIPMAFYAQYEAGPSNEYRLDGAFPVIKLGIEADGEIWHNNQDKIQKDQNRDVSLSRQGWTILRFTDKEIEKQPNDVAAVIKQAVQRIMSNQGMGQSGSSSQQLI